MADSAAGFHVYDPAAGHGLPHDPFNNIVGPRPIGWISTRAGDGTLNLAPYSFFNAFNYTPPLVGFCSTSAKDSLRNAQATGEFTWSLVTRELAEAMNTSSAMVPPETNEFELAGLTPAASRLVQAPRVAESPVSFECRVSQVIPLQAADGTATPATLVMGEVVAVYIQRHLLKDGVYDTAAAHPVVRGGGPADYFEIGEAQRFRLFRPR